MAVQAAVAAPASLRGKIVRWTFDEGPTKGKTFEHRFHEDGSVSYSEVGRDGEPAKATESAVERVTDDVHVVSYLASSGFTLTVVLNFENGTALSFASNDQSWFRAKGSFEVVE